MIGWFGALFTGRLPQFAESYLSGYLHWQVRVSAYQVLLTDAYPPFTLGDSDYPVRVAIPPPGPLNRLAVLFRFILVIPAAIVSGLLVWGGWTIVLFITWLIMLVTGTMPASLYQAYAAVLRYYSRYLGYLLMLTSEYPSEIFGDRLSPGQFAVAQGTARLSGGRPGGLPAPAGERASRAARTGRGTRSGRPAGRLPGRADRSVRAPATRPSRAVIRQPSGYPATRTRPNPAPSPPSQRLPGRTRHPADRLPGRTRHPARRLPGPARPGPAPPGPVLPRPARHRPGRAGQLWQPRRPACANGTVRPVGRRLAVAAGAV